MPRARRRESRIVFRGARAREAANLIVNGASATVPLFLKSMKEVAGLRALAAAEKGGDAATGSPASVTRRARRGCRGRRDIVRARRSARVQAVEQRFGGGDRVRAERRASRVARIVNAGGFEL